MMLLEPDADFAKAFCFEVGAESLGALALGSPTSSE